MSQNIRKSRRSVHRRSGTTERGGLRMIIDQAVTAGINGRSIVVVTDVPEGIDAPPRADVLLELITTLVRGAVDSLGDDGELVITAWQRSDVMEIEVADNGPCVESRPQRLPMAAATLGADLVWQNCPQGGAAVTAVLRRSAQIRDAA